MQPETAYREDVAKAAGHVVDQTNERLDAEIGAAQDRLELLANRLTSVLRMSMPQPSEIDRVTHDSLVGDHSSPLAQSQYTRCHRIGALTAQINDLLERLEI